ncbi:response regulator transcription factor [Paracoccus aestuariivivens]|uniref:Response regulator n=1 Tax=Paracoccus aestuariivivens TaxID=1820333 RepID=A0A6L6JBC7_9RHOB|nr:response regulator [Paracoccus aestuariivivens]MTH77927.1 response regulator [Paracoccus aestuariivivens]
MDIVDKQSAVHVIDDDALLRGAIGSLLRSVGMRTLSYDSGAAFLASDRPDVPGCILLDVRLRGTSGLDFQTQLTALGIHLPVIIMTGYGDVPMSVRAMKAGAVDFLTKPFRDQDLLDAVSVAVERDRLRRQGTRELDALNERFNGLSLREKQVMELITAGLLNKQAAYQLGLSEITVKLYRASAMKKMEAKTLADLVRMADRLGLRV